MAAALRARRTRYDAPDATSKEVILCGLPSKTKSLPFRIRS
jgi:hypothetical protein